jgi:hypothetical protein
LGSVFGIGAPFGVGAAGRIAVAGGLVALVSLVTTGSVDARSDPLFEFFYDKLEFVFHCVSPSFCFGFIGALFTVLNGTGHRGNPAACPLSAV